MNYMLGLLTAVLRDQMRQGHVVRNVAELVDRIPADPKPPDTFTPAEFQAVLEHIDGDRYAIAWQLALTGLRRGEVAGLRWSDIDLSARTLESLRHGSGLASTSWKTPRNPGQVAGPSRYLTTWPRRCGPPGPSRPPTG